eukprot:8569045-Heterocapsa_arctica.AAC.1
MANDDVVVGAHIEISMDGSNTPDDTEEQTKADRPRHPEDRGIWWSKAQQCDVTKWKDPTTRCRDDVAGSCLRGDQCGFAHDPEVGNPKKDWADARWVSFDDTSAPRPPQEY